LYTLPFPSSDTLPTAVHTRESHRQLNGEKIQQHRKDHVSSRVHLQGRP